jgi:hypothetical protein
LSQPEVGTPTASLLTTLQSFMTTVKAVVQGVAKLPPSPGYEPFLLSRGCSPFAARGLAYLCVRVGRRIARESTRRREAYEAIRFLVRPGPQKRALLARAQILLRIWDETSIIETAFSEAGQSEFEFINLLSSAVEGSQIDRERIAEIAAGIAPRLSIPRGPKVSAPSAAYEFARREIPLAGARHRRSLRTRSEEYVDALTEATRREFNDLHFDPRSARRRIKRQREAHPPPQIG